MNENNKQILINGLIDEMEVYINENSLLNVPKKNYLETKSGTNKRHLNNYVERIVNGLFQGQTYQNYAKYLKRNIENFETLNQHDITALVDSIKKFSPELAGRVERSDDTRNELWVVYNAFVEKRDVMDEKILDDAIQMYVLINKSKEIDKELDNLLNIGQVKNWLKTLKDPSKDIDAMDAKLNVISEYRKFKELYEKGNGKVTENNEQKSENAKNILEVFNKPINEPKERVKDKKNILSNFISKMNLKIGGAEERNKIHNQKRRNM